MKYFIYGIFLYVELIPNTNTLNKINNHTFRCLYTCILHCLDVIHSHFFHLYEMSKAIYDLKLI